MYQNWAERHLTLFCIDLNDLALWFITSIPPKIFWDSDVQCQAISRSLFSIFKRQKKTKENLSVWEAELSGHSPSPSLFIVKIAPQHCYIALVLYSAQWFQMTQNSPNIRLQNSWNCLIILVQASFWQIIGVKDMQSPETEIYVILSLIASWLRNREIKLIYFWRVLAIWNHSVV